MLREKRLVSQIFFDGIHLLQVWNRVGYESHMARETTLGNGWSTQFSKTVQAWRMWIKCCWTFVRQQGTSNKNDYHLYFVVNNNFMMPILWTTFSHLQNCSFSWRKTKIILWHPRHKKASLGYVHDHLYNLLYLFQNIHTCLEYSCTKEEYFTMVSGHVPKK